MIAKKPAENEAPGLTAWLARQSLAVPRRHGSAAAAARLLNAAGALGPATDTSGPAAAGTSGPAAAAAAPACVHVAPERPLRRRPAVLLHGRRVRRGTAHPVVRVVAGAPAAVRHGQPAEGPAGAAKPGLYVRIWRPLPSVSRGPPCWWHNHPAVYCGVGGHCQLRSGMRSAARLLRVCVHANLEYYYD